ncbi:12175_t:CDS:1, partial [Entrophospora sp. SA101]
VIISNITMAGLLVSAHVVGPKNVSNALLTGEVVCDENKISMARYLSDFIDCDFKSEHIDESIISFQNYINNTFVNSLVKRLLFL